jgi:DNA-directed RNA polymerase subunit RPC12/RpoP
MAIKVKCQVCGKTLRVRDELAGKTGKCPQCGAVVLVEAVYETPKEGELKQAAESTRSREHEAVGDSVEARMQRLEWQLKRLKVLCLLLLTASLILVGLGVAAVLTSRAVPKGDGFIPDVIKARAFCVQDETGNVRAELALKADGPELGLYDEKGQGFAELKCAHGGLAPRFTLRGPKGETFSAQVWPLLETVSCTVENKGGSASLNATMGTARVQVKGPPLKEPELNGFRAARTIEESMRYLGEHGVPLAEVKIEVQKDIPGITVYDYNEKGGSEFEDFQRPRACLAVFEDVVTLDMMDKTGKLCATMRGDKDGAGFTLQDAKPRAGLTLGAEGPRVFLQDENGKPRAGLAVLKDGPELHLCDEQGKTQALLRSDKDGPWLNLYGENGKSRAVLSALKDGPGVGLTDADDHVRVGLSVRADGPRLGLLDEKGMLRAQMGVTETVSPDGKTTTYPESSVLLFGADGKVRWSAP